MLGELRFLTIVYSSKRADRQLKLKTILLKKIYISFTKIHALSFLRYIYDEKENVNSLKEKEK